VTDASYEAVIYCVIKSDPVGDKFIPVLPELNPVNALNKSSDVKLF
jgi:hypothetical protein